MKKLLLVCVLFVGAFAGKLVTPVEYGSLVISNFNFAYVTKSKSCLELSLNEKLNILSAYNKGTIIVNGSVIVTDDGDIVEAIEADKNNNVLTYNFASSSSSCNILKEYFAKQDAKVKK